MIRKAGCAVQTLCGNKAFTLETYASSLHVSCCYSSAKAPQAQNLPHLPVPKLGDTLTKYLKSVRPHLNDEEFAVTSTLVKDFGAAGGIGQKLQSLLEKRAEQHTNWLADWWLSSAYLEYRDPVVVYSSPGLVFPFRTFQSEQDQLNYAAKTVMAALDYKALIDDNAIPVEMMGKSPLDMSQYKKIFGTCRIPGEKKDRLSFNDSKHITVLHNNHIFHVDLWGEDGKRLNEKQIAEQLKKVKDASKTPAENPVGILTSENRNAWGRAYEIMKKDSVNASSLADVERSLAVLCLDAAAGLRGAGGKDRQQNIAAAQTIHGGGSGANGGNRWFDKTIQFIVGADGVTGLTYEHSPAEGQPIAVMTDFIIDYIDKNKSSDQAASSSPLPPVALKFNVNDDVKASINTAKDNLDRLVADLELNCFTFDKYGKSFIKSQKMSPDSYLQMAMQYAFYRLHKTPGAHYESAATRMFAGGRTETIRSCSVESVEFARAMLGPAPPKEKVVAMQRAVNAHKNYTVQALQGLGVDRHLLGLKLVAIENGIDLPKLYLDAGYVKSAHMRLSTSQVACRCDGFMCYGPLVADGYATCYNPRERDVNFATSAFNSHPATSCQSYRAALEDSLKDMHDVLLQATPSKL
ncbi:hypothetical protein JYU34_002635 [Plutella xylostella]|uniref:Choline/carnitine acyltransferase domain-containing protein n=1 Tax=Plutella xylostella TaxID=51655 RepID=A0ABQ7R2Q7_PLUXY|nr:hypothetical protein JYU34_002635 [Plutella xylostella]